MSRNRHDDTNGLYVLPTAPRRQGVPALWGRMPLRRGAWGAVLGALLWLPGTASAQLAMTPVPAEALDGNPMPPDDEAAELYLSLEYTGQAPVIIPARYARNTVYIPLLPVFEFLKIPVESGSQVGLVSGLLEAQARPFYIDFERLAARVDGQVTAFGRTDFLQDAEHVYVAPHLLFELLGLDLRVDLQHLTLRLRNETDAPLYARLQHERRRAAVTDAFAGVEMPQKVFERERHLVNGGFLDYSASVSQEGGATSSIYGLRLGGELLGGGLGWDMRGWSSPQGTDAFHRVDWRYVFSDNPYLTDVQIGNLNNDRMQAGLVKGVRLSNYPVSPRTLFDRNTVQGTTAPHSEVEILLNDRLVGLINANEAGRYAFELPRTYGMQFVTVRAINPSGGQEETRELWHTPSTFLTPGEIGYNMTAGRHTLTGADFVQADVGKGFGERLTGRVGVDYFRNSGYRPLPYAAVDARLGRQSLVHADYSPGAYGMITLDHYRSSLAHVGVRAGFQKPNTAPAFFSPLAGLWNTARMVEGTVYVPVYILGRSTHTRLTAARYSRAGTQQHVYDGSTQVDLGRVRTYFSWRLNDYAISGRHARHAVLSPALSYTTNRAAGPAWSRGILLRAQADLGVAGSSQSYLRLDAIKQVTRLIHLQLGLIQGRRKDPPMLSFQLSYDLPTTRTSTYLQAEGSGARVSQGVEGSLGFDSATRTLVPYNRNLAAGAGAVVRFFLDENGNGQLDAREQVIDGAAAEIAQGGLVRRGEAQPTRVVNLLPYALYRGRVLESSIPNPLWVPAYTDFAFQTDAHTFKAVNIPLQASGVVDGTVQFPVDADVPEAGLRLHLRHLGSGDVTTLTTFSDGSFYGYQLRPGPYEAAPDSVQLAALGLRSAVPPLVFEIAGTPEGDEVTGLTFALRSATAVPDPEPVLLAVDQRQAPQQDSTASAPQAETTVDVAEVATPAPGLSVVAAQPSPPAPAALACGRAAVAEYRVKKGDCLSVIADRVMEDAQAWKVIWKANEDQIRNPHRIYPGMLLRLPVSDTCEKTGSQESTARGAVAQRYAVAVAALADVGKAEHIAALYQKWGFKAQVVHGLYRGNLRYRIVIGSYASVAQARAYINRAAKQLPSFAWVLTLNGHTAAPEGAALAGK